MENIAYYLLVLILSNYMDDVSSYEIKNDSYLKDTNSESNSDLYFVIPNFPLHKCYCEANHIWENGKCLAMKTGVEFLLRYTPSFLTKEIDSSDFNEVIVQKPKCNSSMSPLKITNVVFTNHKTLFHLESGENFTNLYCVEHVKNSKGNVVLEAEVCLSNLRLPACCPSAHYLSLLNYECYPNENATFFQPPVNMASSLINSTSVTPYLHHFPKCNPKHFERKLLNPNNGISLQYQKSQIVFFHWEGNPVESLPTVKFPSDYCVALENHGRTSMYSVLFWDELSTLYCSNVSSAFVEEEEEEECDKIMNWLLLLLVSFSSVFLLLILGLHAAMPELRKSLGSKITICHVASLFCGFCLLLLLHISYPVNCKVYGPLIQVCFLSTFFWLNVMCFDIWRKLRCRSPAGETIQSSRIQFIRYSIYAWGSPLLIGIVTVVMDNIPSLDGAPGVIVPGFGKKTHCWFHNEEATLVYYFGIIAMLMAINVFFFIWVFVVLLRANCTYKKVLKNNQKSNDRTWIYLKIFGVMGITWFCEFLSWKEGTCKYWVITDIINGLRGLMLFIIFFGNKKSVNKIRQRFSTMNQTLHDQVSRSVNNLRKLGLKLPSGTLETGIESRRTSETNTELSNRTNNQETENG